MKKLLLLLITLFIMIFLSSCTRTIGYKHNVVWKSENSDILTLYIEGLNNAIAYGYLNIEDTQIDVVAYLLWSQSKLLLYDKDGAIHMHENNGEMSGSLAILTISAPLAWYGWFSTTTMNVKTEHNYSKYSELDNLNFTMKVSDIPQDELNTKNFIDVKWVNEDLKISFKGDSLSYFTGIDYGILTLDNITKKIYFVFLDDNKFEIHEDNDENTLLISGTYITHYDSMTLQIDQDNIYNNQYSDIEMTYGYLY